MSEPHEFEDEKDTHNHEEEEKVDDKGPQLGEVAILTCITIINSANST